MTRLFKTRINSILTILLLSFIFVVLLGIFLLKINNRTQETIANPILNQPVKSQAENSFNCRYELRIPSINDKDPLIIFCNNLFKVRFYSNRLGLLGPDPILDSFDSFPSLFYANGDLKDPAPSVRVESITPTKIGTILHLSNTANTGGWVSESTAMYLIATHSAKQIYKRTETDPGMHGYATLESSNPIVIKNRIHTGSLGPRSSYVQWIDFYQWDPKLEQLNLVNNKFKLNFQNLYQEYQQKNNTICQNYSNKPLSELYQIRQEKDSICSDKESEPVVQPDQVRHFLKAMQTIKRIIQGENISYQDISL